MTTEKERIKEMVRNAWDNLCLYREMFGSDSDSAKIQLYTWRALDKLYRDLYDEEY